MGCVRVRHCPVFPHLNASLRGWRQAYCDSDVGWRECARYQRFTAGQPVPLGMLPNGKVAAAIVDATAAPTESATACGQAPVRHVARPQPWWRRILRRPR
jgi:hypothetical protein